jgi:hypothetical protein
MQCKYNADATQLDVEKWRRRLEIEVEKEER